MEAKNFVPFYFDGNQFFDEVASIVAWLRLCHAYRDHFSCKSEKENRKELMARATATSPTEDVEVRGIPAPSWHGLPNFGFRCEHIGQNLTLEAWLKKKGMYALLLEAVEIEQ